MIDLGEWVMEEKRITGESIETENVLERIAGNYEYH